MSTADEKLTLEDQVWIEVQRSLRIKPFAQAIHKAQDWRDRLRAIEAYYGDIWHDIYRSDGLVWPFDPYEVDWPMLFTPIEAALWSDIRALGLVLHPQYPVKTEERTYCADFASAKFRVAIECDGKAFHGDKVRDRARDRDFELSGWRVFRFTGAQCREDFNAETMQRSTVSKSLERIAREHFRPEADVTDNGRRVL